VFAVSGCPFCEPRDQGLCLARIFSAASRPLNDVNPRPGTKCAKQNRANKENARGAAARWILFAKHPPRVLYAHFVGNARSR
jgi:hypothetical protein